jgi:hypothetical protein
MMYVDGEVQEALWFQHAAELPDDLAWLFGVVDDVIAKNDVERGGQKWEALSRGRTRQGPALNVGKEMGVVDGQLVDADAPALVIYVLNVVDVVDVVEVENQASTAAANFEKTGPNRDRSGLFEPCAHVLSRSFSAFDNVRFEPTNGPEGVRLFLLIQELAAKSPPGLRVPGSLAPTA